MNQGEHGEHGEKVDETQPRLFHKNLRALRGFILLLSCVAI